MVRLGPGLVCVRESVWSEANADSSRWPGRCVPEPRLAPGDAHGHDVGPNCDGGWPGDVVVVDDVARLSRRQERVIATAPSSRTCRPVDTRLDIKPDNKHPITTHGGHSC